MDNYVEFEQQIAKLFSKAGWIVETAKTNQPGYDLVVKKDNYVGAVQAKWLKSNVATPQLLKFVDFLDSLEGKQFNCGFFITTKGFGGPARALIRSWGKDVKVLCGIASDGKIDWERGIQEIINDSTPINPPEENENREREKVYFGVFTCKGGVGKTTIAAHLAGAFVLQGFDIALLDLDPEQNLHKLVGDGVYLPKPKGSGAGNIIQVFNGEDWDEDAARECKLVICDCSPALERNPKELIERMDYCIIPTTLNPLGINKHGTVIQNTVKEIRKINKKAHLFVLVNNFKDPGYKRLQLLKRTFFEVYKEISKSDDKFHCIDPEQACIRASEQLYYWGIHILENPDNPDSQLAFKLVGGRCHPREDFINLADYIEQKAGLGSLRSK
jgi:cellulose biosynthesis protein BcsQ